MNTELNEEEFNVIPEVDIEQRMEDERQYDEMMAIEEPEYLPCSEEEIFMQILEDERNEFTNLNY